MNSDSLWEALICFSIGSSDSHLMPLSSLTTHSALIIPCSPKPPAITCQTNLHKSCVKEYFTQLLAGQVKLAAQISWPQDGNSLLGQPPAPLLSLQGCHLPIAGWFLWMKSKDLHAKVPALGSTVLPGT